MVSYLYVQKLKSLFIFSIVAVFKILVPVCSISFKFDVAKALSLPMLGMYQLP